MRNRVASWVVGPLPPSMVDLVSASFMADGAVRQAPQEPAGYWARADIALRLGDRELLDAALSGSAARRARSTRRRRERMIALAAGPFGAPALGLGRSSGRPAGLPRDDVARAPTPMVPAAAPGGGRRHDRGDSVRRAVGAGVARGRTSSASEHRRCRPRSDEPPEPPTSSSNPLAFADVLTELADRGLKATKRGDHAAAARYWTAVTKAVPDRSYGYARLCESLEALGQRDQAIVACRNAVTRECSSVHDYVHLSELLLLKDGPLTPTERRQVDVSIGQLAKEPKASIPTDRLRCELAAREHDLNELRASSARLTAAAPDDLKTIWCQWALAVETRDGKTAEDSIERVRATGTHGKLAVEMEQATPDLRVRRPAKLARATRWGASGALAFLLALSLYAGGKRGLGSLRGGAAPEETQSSRGQK